MGKLLVSLTKQLNTEHKQDAEDCIIIYNKLLELTEHIWESEWNVLTKVTFVGIFPNSVRIYKPSTIGKIFLNGLK